MLTFEDSRYAQYVSALFCPPTCSIGGILINVISYKFPPTDFNPGGLLKVNIGIKPTFMGSI